MDPAKIPPLAELHLHLYGCLSAKTLLAQLLRNMPHVDFGPYERSFEEAYGLRPPLREVLDRCRANAPDSLASFEKLFRFGEEDAGNFARFQAKFDLIIAGSAFSFGKLLGSRLGRPAAALLADEITEFTAAICEEQQRQGICYAEQRLLLNSSTEWDWALPAVRRGIPSDPRAFTMRIAASLPRADPWTQWERISILALADGGDLLTGVDFCHIEEGHPPKDKGAFFAAVRDFNQRYPARALAILYHVGESFTDKSLESAVRWVQEAAEMGAHRLGHAIALGIEPLAFLRPGVSGTIDGQHTRRESAAERIDQLGYDLRHAEGLARHGVIIDCAAAADEQARLARGRLDDLVVHVYDRQRLDEVRRRQDFAMKAVQKSGAVIEVCPTSNLRIGGIADGQHHPVHRFLEAGLRVVIASDDPGIFGTTLAEEVAWVTREARLTDEERDALLWDAWRYRSEVLTGREQVPPRII